MPRWGLSDDLAGLRPWGIDRALLKPSKTNTDPVHEAVYVNELERLIMDSPPFQRLRRVRQLGTTHLVYSGAVHTRFQHSLGALRVVQDLFDDVLDNPISNSLQDDLLHEWRRDMEPVEVNRRIAESIVLARLGALLHDFCHVPYGHTVEDDFRLLVPHDANQSRFDRLWEELHPKARDALQGELKQQLELLILSKSRHTTQPKYPFVLDLVGNTICADLIDYLWRDYYFTGLPGKLGSRFFTYFFVTSSREPDDKASHMALRIEKNGHLRSDVISEVFKYLRYRYELSERALHHHAKVAADTMIAHAIDMWIQADGKDAVDAALTTYGDDGLLEHLAEAGLEGASELAADVRDRRLYKEHCRSSGDVTRLRKDALYDEWKQSGVRERVQSRLTKGLGLKQPWHVLLSVPNPAMRLKAADVLVSWHGAITTLRIWDEQHAKRASELAASHENLWSIQLFVHPSLDDEDRDRAAAYVASELGIQWDEKPGTRLADPVFERALEELTRERGLVATQRQEIRAAAFRTKPDPAGDETFIALKSRLGALVAEVSETPPRRQSESAHDSRTSPPTKPIRPKRDSRQTSDTLGDDTPRQGGLLEE